MRTQSVSAWLTIVGLALLSSTGCGPGETGGEAGSGTVASTETAGSAPPAKAVAARDEHTGHDHRNERPLPAFDGRLLDGTKRSISEFLGQRLVLFFFNPETDDADAAGGVMASLASERTQHNFEIVGVAMGSSYDEIVAFKERHGLDVPIYDDSAARIAGRIGLRSRLAVLGIDPEGYLQFGMGAFPSDLPDPAGAFESQLREHLRLPSGHAAVAATGALDRRPAAPPFETVRIDGGADRWDMGAHAGKPLVLVFFLHTCPHCHHALEFFKGALAKLPEESRPVLVGISVQDRPSAVRARLRDDGLDYFPVLTDPDSSVRSQYGVFGGVPDIVFVAPDGRIEHRIQGWDSNRDPAVARMVLAKIAGESIPMILNPKGYTGSQVCGICHDAAHDTWNYTTHAAAFDTLVTHGVTNDAECVSCHVVGFDQPGGYDMASAPAHLEGVGCESCHGRGGPHLSPGFVQNDDYQAVCESCHNPEHSLGFDYASFSTKISHEAIAALSGAEREAMLAGRGKPRDLLPTTSAVVGSEACKDCHAAEYATWAASPHAHAVATLEAEGEAANAQCLACHTTAMGREGGFPKDGVVGDHSDLARVGCESCHGPGGNHVKEDTAKRGSIVSLGDKCDSCVILQICGSCHDDDNDPGFRFRVQERIDAQRHGTIEAGTGKPKGSTAHRLHDRPEVALEHAFHALDQRG